MPDIDKRGQPCRQHERRHHPAQPAQQANIARAGGVVDTARRS